MAGHLSFLLANNLDDATRAIVDMVGVMKDEAKRQRQNHHFAQLLADATSPAAAEAVLRGLFRDTLGLADEKELWRILAVYGRVGCMATATFEGLLQECPIDRVTGERLAAFLDGPGTLLLPGEREM